MDKSTVQSLIAKVRQYKAASYCFAAGICTMLAGHPQELMAGTPAKKSPLKMMPVNGQREFNLNRLVNGCNLSFLDKLKQDRRVSGDFYSSLRAPAFFAGTDDCPGTSIPGGASFTDAAGTTIGGNNTVNQINSCIPFPAVAGPDKVYKMVLPAPASRTTCQITLTPQSTFDAGVYLLSQGSGGCPSGTHNTMTNCVIGKDAGFKGVAETITTAQMNTVPAGIYYVLVDSFYCGNDLSECTAPGSGANECATGSPECWHGTYTLAISNCNMVTPTATLTNLSGRVLTSSGNGIRNVIVTLTDDLGVSRTVPTSSFGYYIFDGVEVGRSYTVSVRSKQYTFETSSQLITINDELSNVDFTALK